MSTEIYQKWDNKYGNFIDFLATTCALENGKPRDNPRYFGCAA